MQTCKYMQLLMYRQNLRYTCHFRSLFVDSRLVPFSVTHVVVFFLKWVVKKDCPLMKNVAYSRKYTYLQYRCVCHFRKCNNQNTESEKPSRFNAMHLLDRILFIHLLISTPIGAVLSIAVKHSRVEFENQKIGKWYKTNTIGFLEFVSWKFWKCLFQFSKYIYLLVRTIIKITPFEVFFDFENLF